MHCARKQHTKEIFLTFLDDIFTIIILFPFFFFFVIVLFKLGIFNCSLGRMNERMNSCMISDGNIFLYKDQ